MENRDVFGNEKNIGENTLEIEKEVVSDDTDTLSLAAETEDITLKGYLTDIAELLYTEQWDTARNACDYALRFYPEDEQINCYKLMTIFKINKRIAFTNATVPLDTYNEYNKIINGKNESLKKELIKYNIYIKQRNEKDRCDAVYKLAVKEMNTAKRADQFEKAYKMFLSVKAYSNAGALAENCKNEAEKLKNNEIYSAAMRKMNADHLVPDAYIEEIMQANKMFLSLGDWRDSAERAEYCLQLAERVRNKQEFEVAERKKRKIRIKRRLKIAVMVLLPLLCILVAAAFLMEPYILPGVRYLNAKKLMKDGQFMSAAEIFEEIDGFADSNDMIVQAFDGKLQQLLSENEFAAAYNLIESANDYKMSERNKNEMLKAYWRAYFADLNVGDTLYYGEYEQNNKDSDGKEAVKWIVLDRPGENELLLLSAYIINNCDYDYDDGDDSAVSWYDSRVRTLASMFYHNAFSDVEESFIDRNFSDGKSIDYAFLLSKEEAQKYPDILKSKVTIWTAEYMDAYVDSKGFGEWWLRDTAGDDTAYIVTAGGVVKVVDVYTDAGLRPAIRIKY